MPAALRCLIIDDSPLILTTTSLLLKHQGIVPVTALDGKTGIAIAGEQKPDFIILDVMMPGMNGLEVLDVLKADPLTADIPVIFCTAVDTDFYETMLTNTAARAVLRKPFHLGDLLTLIEDLFAGVQP